MIPLRLLAVVGGLLLLAPAAAEAKIRVHTDASGKVVISNEGSEGAPAPAAVESNIQAPGRGRRPEMAPPPMIDQAPPDEPMPLPPPPPPGRQKVEIPDTPPAIRSVSTEAADRIARRPVPKPAAPASETPPIRVNLSAEGVLVITNLPENSPSPEALPPARVARPGRLVVPDGPAAWEDSPVADLIRPAAHRPRKAAAVAPPALKQGAIRRQRDADGVIRISNIEAAPPAALAAAPPSRLVAPAAAPPPGPPARPLVVKRDPKGRLQIYTKEPEKPLLAGLPPPGAIDRLDPVIAPIVAEASRTYQLPPSLILSVIRMESNFVPWAVSPKGAMGLMQLMPGTAADLGVQEPFCPRQNIMGGSRYLRHLLNCFGGSLPLAVAAYNAGPHRVVQAGHQIPEIKETKQFVSQVLGLYSLLEKPGPVPRP